MVLIGLVTMSTSLDNPQEPPSPTVEQILEDLKAANEDDIVFKLPPLLSDEKARTQANVKNTSVAKEECNSQYSSNAEDVREKTEKTDDVMMERQSHEQLYNKLTSFLDNYKALVSSERLLASFERDLRSKKEELEEAIDKVNEAWKIGKENT